MQQRPPHSFFPTGQQQQQQNQNFVPQYPHQNQPNPNHRTYRFHQAPPPPGLHPIQNQNFPPNHQHQFQQRFRFNGPGPAQQQDFPPTYYQHQRQQHPLQPQSILQNRLNVCQPPPQPTYPTVPQQQKRPIPQQTPQQFHQPPRYPMYPSNFHENKFLDPAPHAAIISPPIDEDRFSCETPMPLPLECQLGQTPDTPSTSPDIDQPVFNFSAGEIDTSELLRLQLNDCESRNEEPQLFPSPPLRNFIPYVKRHRRTKREIIEDRQRQLRSTLRECSVPIEKMEVKKSVRLFFSGSEVLVRENLPMFPSKMKIVPNKFMRVVNIGCMKTAKSLIFSCMREECKFKSYDKTVFRAHLENYHSSCVRSCESRCELCAGVLTFSSVQEELSHLECDLDIYGCCFKNQPIYHSQIPVPVSQNLPSTSAASESSSSSASDQINKLLEIMSVRSETNGILDFGELFGSKSSGNKEEPASTSTQPAPVVPEVAEKVDKPVQIAADDDDEVDEPVLVIDEKIDDQADIVADKVDEDVETEKVEDPVETVNDKVESPSENDKLNEVVETEKIPEKVSENSPEQEKAESSESEDEAPLAVLLVNSRKRRSTSTVSTESEPLNKKPCSEKRRTQVPAKLQDFLKESEMDELDRMLDEDNTHTRRKDPDFIPEEDEEMEEELEDDEDESIEMELDDDESDEDNDDDSESEESEFDLIADLPLVDRKLKLNKRSKIGKQMMNHKQKKRDNLILRISKLENGVYVSESSKDGSETKSQALKESTSKTQEMTEESDESSSESEDEADKIRMFKYLRVFIRSSKCFVKLKKIDYSNYDYFDVEMENVLSSAPPKPAAASTNTKDKSSKSLILKLRKIKSNEYLRNSQIPTATSMDTPDASDESPSPTTEKAMNETDINSTELFIEGSSEKLVDFGSESEDANHNSLSNPSTIEEKFAQIIENDLDLDSPMTTEDESQQFELSQTQNEPKVMCKLAPLYPWCDEEIANLWEKEEKHYKKLLEEPSLLARYKCMAQNCSYHSYNMDEFKKHLSSVHASNKFHVCSSCLADFTKIQKFMEHIEECSRLYRYQCGKCMYRASENIYIDRHVRQYHEGCHNYFELDDWKGSYNEKKEEAKKQLLDKMHSSIKRTCKFCKLKFSFIEDYSEHLQNKVLNKNWKEKEKDILDEISKIIDNRTEDLEDDDDEFKFGSFRCLYCLDTFNTIEHMECHLSDMHADKFSFVGSICERKAAIFDIHVKMEFKPQKTLIITDVISLCDDED